MDKQPDTTISDAQIPVSDKQQSLAPDTTHQQDVTTAGQRTVNLLWEKTQARIALWVIGVGMFVNSLLIIALVLLDKDITVNRLAVISIALQFINLTAGIVIGFYFSRTNHTNVGGVGPKTGLPR